MSRRNRDSRRARKNRIHPRWTFGIGFVAFLIGSWFIYYEFHDLLSRALILKLCLAIVAMVGIAQIVQNAKDAAKERELRLKSRPLSKTSSNALLYRNDFRKAILNNVTPSLHSSSVISSYEFQSFSEFDFNDSVLVDSDSDDDSQSDDHSDSDSDSNSDDFKNGKLLSISCFTARIKQTEWTTYQNSMWSSLTSNHSNPHHHNLDDDGDGNQYYITCVLHPNIRSIHHQQCPLNLMVIFDLNTISNIQSIVGILERITCSHLKNTDKFGFIIYHNDRTVMNQKVLPFDEYDIRTLSDLMTQIESISIQSIHQRSGYKSNGDHSGGTTFKDRYRSSCSLLSDDNENELNDNENRIIYISPHRLSTDDIEEIRLLSLKRIYTSILVMDSMDSMNSVDDAQFEGNGMNEFWNHSDSPNTQPTVDDRNKVQNLLTQICDIKGCYGHRIGSDEELIDIFEHRFESMIRSFAFNLCIRLEVTKHFRIHQIFDTISRSKMDYEMESDDVVTIVMQRNVFQTLEPRLILIELRKSEEMDFGKLLDEGLAQFYKRNASAKGRGQYFDKNGRGKFEKYLEKYRDDKGEEDKDRLERKEVKVVMTYHDRLLKGYHEEKVIEFKSKVYNQSGRYYYDNVDVRKLILLFEYDRMLRRWIRWNEKKKRKQMEGNNRKQMVIIKRMNEMFVVFRRHFANESLIIGDPDLQRELEVLRHLTS